ncbi:unnamed protein product [Orchesella dallaii]|uniref:Uncharacterized protein n=1 Tax=Orchesella dallaii TaxID=48710 RepID=A0ABP1Q1M1_9HEXA
MLLAICLCPCMSLQESVKVLAIIDALLSLLNIIFYITALVAIATDNLDYVQIDGQRAAAQVVAIILIAIYLLGSIIQILIAAKLYSGGKNKHYQRCKFWLKITYVLVVLQIIGLITDVSDGEFKGYSAAASFSDLLYKLYEMLVVSMFLTELEDRHEQVGKLESQAGVGVSSASSPFQNQPQTHSDKPNMNNSHQENPYTPTTTTELGFRNQDPFSTPLLNV